VTHQVTEILLRQIWGVQPTREQIEAVVRQVQGEKYMLKIKHIVLCVCLSHTCFHTEGRDLFNSQKIITWDDRILRYDGKPVSEEEAKKLLVCPISFLSTFKLLKLVVIF